MPPYSRSKILAAKTSVKNWINSIKGKGYKFIICHKCNHKMFTNNSHRQKRMIRHFLKCDPKKVQWCSVCITHSTTSNLCMKIHKAKKHPCHLKFQHIFDCSKSNILPQFSNQTIQAISHQWKNLDIDTLFTNPDIFKKFEIIPKKTESIYDNKSINETQNVSNELTSQVSCQTQILQNRFSSKQKIHQKMKSQFPIAAIDVETSKFYPTDELSKLKLESNSYRKQLGDIVSLSIVSIDCNLQIQRTSYIFKPKKLIDQKAFQIHGFSNQFFAKNDDTYHHFNKEVGEEINFKLRDMAQVYAHNQAFDFYHIHQQFNSVGLEFIVPIKFSCTYQLALDLGLPLQLKHLLNALNIGQRRSNIHSSQEDAEFALLAAIKMIWLKEKGLKNRPQYLCWYKTIQSREYDELSLNRLNQILKEYDIILKESYTGKNLNKENLVVELCSGQGRNISTILNYLKPTQYIAIDYDQHCNQEINERWESCETCKVTALTMNVSEFIKENRILTCYGVIGQWSLGYMNRQQQEQLLEWIHKDLQTICLFIEPIGKGEYLDSNRLKANQKVYYDRLFQAKGIKVHKEGRFIWNDLDQEFDHYESSISKGRVIEFARTYYWIVS